MFQPASEQPIRSTKSGGAASKHEAKTLWVRDTEIQDVLIDAAARGKWGRLENYLNQLESHSRVRGAPLMRALNTPKGGRDMPLLGVMVCHDAPLKLLQRVIDVGASTAFRCTLHEPTDWRVGKCSLIHLAVLKGRLDLLSVLPPRIGGGQLENARGECPLRQFARLAPDRAFSHDSIIGTLGVAARRYVEAGGAGTELAKAVSMFIVRKQWGAAQIIIDSWADTKGVSLEGQIARPTLCKWAAYGMIEQAPSAFFNSLRAASASKNSHSAPALGDFLAKDFLYDYVPHAMYEFPLANHDWSAFESRLQRLAACRGIFDHEMLSGFLNTVSLFPAPFTVDAELEALGLIDGFSQLQPLSLLQCMVFGRAPVSVIKLACELGADMTYQAWIGNEGKIVADGTAFHIAIKRDDLERMKALTESGYPFLQINGSGENELHYLFSQNQGNLAPKKLPLLLHILEAGGSTIENFALPQAVREIYKVSGYSLEKLLKLAEAYEAEGDRAIDQTVYVPRTYEILDRMGKLIEVGEDEVRHAFAKEVENMWSDFGDVLGHLPLIDQLPERAISLLSPEVKNLVRQLHAALSASFQERVQTDSDGDDAEVVDDDSWEMSADGIETLAELDDEPSEETEGEFLSFPDFSGAEFGFTYDDPMLRSEAVSDSYDEIDILDDGDEVSDEVPEKPVLEEVAGSDEVPMEVAEPPEVIDPPKVFEKTLLEELELSEDEIVEILKEKSAEDELEDKAPKGLPLKVKELPGGAMTMATMSEVVSYRGANRHEVRRALQRCIDEGEPYEGYLLVKALSEVRLTKPSELSAISRSLRSLLYRFPPGVANYMGDILDGVMSNGNGYHPYMAELLCLLHNPLDKLKGPGSIGGLTLGISSVAGLNRYGQVSGDLVNAWGQIGTWNFSFPAFRFDSQAINLPEDGKGGGVTLMEKAGMTRLIDPVDEFWINPKTKQKEHLLGSLFYVGKGTHFQKEFDYAEAQKLGFAPLGQDTTAVFRRACDIFSHPSHGTLIIRNSSHNFGRDRFEHPGLFSLKKRTLTEVLLLSKDEITREFRAVTSRAHFDAFAEGYGDTLTNGAHPLNFLMGQANTIRAAYARKKFDCNYSTAWSSDGSTLLGGYRSELFQSVVSLLENRWELAQRFPERKIVVPDLAVANPDYFLAPHARLQTTEGAIEVLRKLADGKENEISESDLRREGVRDFINASLMKGRSSELVLLPPED